MLFDSTTFFSSVYGHIRSLYYLSCCPKNNHVLQDPVEAGRLYDRPFSRAFLNKEYCHAI